MESSKVYKLGRLMGTLEGRVLGMEDVQEGDVKLFREIEETVGELVDEIVKEPAIVHINDIPAFEKPVDWSKVTVDSTAGPIPLNYD